MNEFYSFYNMKNNRKEIKVKKEDEIKKKKTMKKKEREINLS